ncbi:uncharacterized protein [Amphiura filiformis]|uniref:uncharacterized protein n=1 Tax=Amphiura filiformis TaxID=82378 RepID=UPI003B21492A
MIMATFVGLRTIHQSDFSHILLVTGLSFVLHATLVTEAADDINVPPQVRMDIADDGSCSYILKMPPCGQCNCAEEKQAMNDLKLRMDDLEDKIKQLIESDESGYWNSPREIYDYSDSFVPDKTGETHHVITEHWHDTKHLSPSELEHTNRTGESQPTKTDLNYPLNREDSLDSYTRELRPPQRLQGTSTSNTSPATFPEVDSSLEEGDGSDIDLHFHKIIEVTQDTPLMKLSD